MTSHNPSTLLAQAAALLGDETDYVANAANLAALIFHELPELNWAGFYFYDGHELVLGPFQGQPACLRIPLDRGVCGFAATQRRPVRVDDVHRFPDHIACDVNSASELVVPLLAGDQLLGVLDLDSPRRGRFEAADEALLEALAALYIRASNSVSCCAFPRQPAVA